MILIWWSWCLRNFPKPGFPSPLRNQALSAPDPKTAEFYYEVEGRRLRKILYFNVLSYRRKQ